jgi:signal transduction histidine kinase
MKYYKVLIIICLFTLLSGGGVWLKYRTELGSEQPLKTRVGIELNKFVITTQEIAQINFDDYKPAVLSPKSVLPTTHQFERKEIAKLIEVAVSCRDLKNDLENNELQKALNWHRFMCGYRSSLPNEFFVTGPMFHPSGQSYVALAIKSKKKQFQTTKWMSLHRGYLHIKERYLAEKITPLTFSEKILSSFSFDELRIIEERGRVILSEDYFVTRSDKRNKGGVSLPYLVYNMADWTEFADGSAVIASLLGRSECALAIGNSCWEAKPKFLSGIQNLIGILVAVGSGLFIIVFLLAISNRILVWARLNKERQRMLQVFTHEIRTPVGNLKLIVESFRKIFDELPNSGQKLFLELCDEVQRIEKVAQSSEGFLKAPNKNDAKIVMTKLCLNDFLEEAVSPWSHEVTLETPAIPVHIQTDPYWLSVCIGNLIENAIKHGEPPITVTLKLAGKFANIIVSNNGEITEQKLSVLAKPFKKRAGSDGLGLGLNITKSTVKALHGKLVFESKPPTFSIVLRCTP